MNFDEFCKKNTSKDEFIRDACTDIRSVIYVLCGNNNPPPADWHTSYKKVKKYSFSQGIFLEASVHIARAWREYIHQVKKVPPITETQRKMARNHRTLPFHLYRKQGKYYEIVDRDDKIYKTLELGITPETAIKLSDDESDDINYIRLYPKHHSPFCNTWDFRYSSDEDAQKEYEDFHKEYLEKLHLIASLIIKN